MRVSTLLKFALGVLVIVVSTSCSVAYDLARFPGLEQRIREYYALEMRGQWNSTYEFRHSAFKRSVRKDAYIATMSRDSTGWKFVDYRIKAVSQEGDKVKVSMVFVEIPPSDFLQLPALKDKKIGEFQFDDDSVWVREGNEWYAYSPGMRGHMSLNSPVVVR